MNILGKIARKFTPYPYKFIYQKPDTAVRSKLRQDVVRLNVGEKVFIELYWKDVELGRGPAIILNIQGYEIMRFDCFGSPGGHYHIKVTEWHRSSEHRLQMPEPTPEAQIERALFEIRYNNRWVLDRHPLSRVRKVIIDNDQLHAATENARGILLSYINLPEVQTPTVNDLN